MSYRQQVQTLFQLHVDPAFRAGFREDPVQAAPGLTEPERHELVKLPVARQRAKGGEERDVPVAEASTAFMRIGIQSRCRIALPRTYAILEEIAAAAGHSLEIDFLRHVDLWRAIPPEYHRDDIEGNPAVHWTETARVLQMANRVYWQVYNYALDVARRESQRIPYLGDLARFEFDTLARRIVLYKRFVAPGPRKAEPDAQSRLVLSVYAALASYDYSFGGPVPTAVRTGVVFLYNGERLRVLQVDQESYAALTSLDGSVRLGDVPGRARRVVEGLAALGVLVVAS